MEGKLFHHLFACYKSSDYKADLLKAPVNETTDVVVLLSNIKKIENNSFERFTKLRMLALIANDIQEIEEQAFSGLPGLETLMIVANNLSIVKGVWFEHLPRLEMIHLAYNNFNAIDDKFGEVIGKLTTNVYVDLSNNNLQKLPNNINEILDERIRVQNNPWNFKQALIILNRIEDNVLYPKLGALRDSVYNASMRCNSTLPSNVSDDDFEQCAKDLLGKLIKKS